MNRPYIVINCAMTADGKTALHSGKQLRISSPEDIERMYKLRNECDAVLVGINTVLLDDPKLTVKEKHVEKIRQPIRIVLDSHCRTPVNSQIVNTKSKTFIIVRKGVKCVNKYNENVEIIACETDENDLINLNCLMDRLYEKKIKKLMVEGGGSVIWSFLKEKLVDDLFTYMGNMIVGGKNTPTMTEGIGFENEDELIHIKIVDFSRLGKGFLFHYKLV